MPYDPRLAMTNSQLRNQEMRGALEDFMGFFKQKKATADEAEKQALIKELSAGPTTSRMPEGAGGLDAGAMGGIDAMNNEASTKHLAEAKAKYLMKYGQKPTTAADFMAEDAVQGEQMAQIGDAKKKRAGLEGFASSLDADAALSPTEKAFYKTKPEAYGEKLKPAGITYLPTTTGYVTAPTKAPVGGAGPIATPLLDASGAAAKPIPRPVPKEPKSLVEIEAEAKARAEGALAGAGDKPLSGDASKLSGYVTTLESQAKILQSMLKKDGIRKIVYEYKKGNPEYTNVIDDISDAKGRLRSGGVVGVSEADRFSAPFTSVMSGVYGNNDAAEKALQMVLSEAATVREGMKQKPKGEAPGADSGGGTVWRKAKDGKEYEYNASTKQPTGNSR